MNCERVRDLIDQYVGGELDPAAVTQIAEHLSSCPACREHEVCAREIARTLSGMKIKGPSALRSRIVSEALRSRTQSTASWRPWALAASLVVMAGVYWNWGSRPALDPGSSTSISALPPVDSAPVTVAADTHSADRLAESSSHAPSSRVAHRERPAPVNHAASGDTPIRDEWEDTFILTPNSSRDPLAGDRSEDDDAAERLERLRQRARETENN